MTRTRSRDLLAGLLLALIAALALQAQQTATRKSYVFRGKVEKIDAATNSVTVANDRIPGWMDMSMPHSYQLDPPAILKQLKPGDFIVATVYDDDFGKLYAVRLDTSRTTGDLPPLSYACRTPGEELDVSDAPGRCEKSGAPLEPVRIARIYTCITHPVTKNEQPGICRLDGKELVPVDAELYFVCQGSPARYLDPGQCANGTPRAKTWELRPHGDHNPRHGGTMFMTKDGRVHHVEGTFVAPGIFRAYFYDLMTQPVPPTGVVARVTLADPLTSREIGQPIPLAHVATSPVNTLEAAVPAAKMPFQIKMLVSIRPGEPELPFYFSFSAYSMEP